MTQIKAAAAALRQLARMWKTIASAPADKDLELAVIDEDGCHALVFPCRRRDDVWVDPRDGRPVQVRPSHWREWTATTRANGH
ncbi:hypothetical protein RHIZO_04146 [Rhizobiaceae bacterium]|nr:hypothetical protein RHIZO_04146 [Rhizobiaceae bacterium]